MISFTYKARDRYGVMTSGIMEAPDSKAVAHRLDTLGYSPVSISSQESSGVVSKLELWIASFQKVSPEEIIVFTRQLASILESGVPLVEGLDAVQQQVKNKRFKYVILAIKADIENGAPFSEALEKQGKVFSSLTVNMVRAGEKAGILDEVLDRVSNLLEKDQDTVNKIKLATRYPTIVLISIFFAFIVFTIVIIPSFSKFFGAFQVDLPLPTRILIALNKLMVDYWYWMVLAVVAAGYLGKKALATEKGRYSFDRYLLSLPIFGDLFSKIYLSRFSRMLAAMIKSGIPILEGLVISANTVGNKVISRVIVDIRDQVSEGKGLTEPMKGSQIFPPIAISMVAIGEKAGTLEHMLNKVADFFDRESDYTIKNLTPLLEPIMILVLGGMILIFALGIFLPMWDLIKVYKTF